MEELDVPIPEVSEVFFVLVAQLPPEEERCMCVAFETSWLGLKPFHIVLLVLGSA